MMLASLLAALTAAVTVLEHRYAAAFFNTGPLTFTHMRFELTLQTAPLQMPPDAQAYRFHPLVSQLPIFVHITLAATSDVSSSDRFGYNAFVFAFLLYSVYDHSNLSMQVTKLTPSSCVMSHAPLTGACNDDIVVQYSSRHFGHGRVWLRCTQPRRR